MFPPFWLISTRPFFRFQHDKLNEKTNCTDYYETFRSSKLDIPIILTVLFSKTHQKSVCRAAHSHQLFNNSRGHSLTHNWFFHWRCCLFPTSLSIFFSYSLLVWSCLSSSPTCFIAFLSLSLPVPLSNNWFVSSSHYHPGRCYSPSAQKLFWHLPHR